MLPRIPTDSPVYHLHAVEYTRMDAKAFPVYQALKLRNDETAIKAFIEEQEQLKARHYRLYRGYEEELEQHYYRKQLTFDISFLNLYFILDAHRNLLPKLPINTLLESQTKLFELPLPSRPQVHNPSTIFTGQAAAFKYDHYYGLNHLDFLHLSNWVTFFKRTTLHQPKQLLKEMRAIHQNNKTYLAFLQHYYKLTSPTTDPLWHQNLVWSFDEDEWQQFQYDQYHWERFCYKVNELYLFLQHCLNFKHCWVLLRLSYV